MSAEIVNLRRARKTKARDARDRQAAENRAKFGQPKAQRAKAGAERQHTVKTLDNAFRGPADNPADDDGPTST